jgi:hypothetical protein
VLFFEFFPAFITVLGAIVATWLYFSNRRAPDESAQNARRRRERDERQDAARREGPIDDARPRRPSMRG